MKSILSILTALAVGTVVATADEAKKPGAAGEKPHHDPEAVFKKLDTDGDGFVSLKEFKAGPMGQKDPAKAEEIFKKKDANGDGKLSLDEFKAHAPHGEKGSEKAPAKSAEKK